MGKPLLFLRRLHNLSVCSGRSWILGVARISKDSRLTDGRWVWVKCNQNETMRGKSSLFGKRHFSSKCAYFSGSFLDRPVWLLLGLMGYDGCPQCLSQHCFITISEANLKFWPHPRAKVLKLKPAWQFPSVQYEVATCWPLSAGVHLFCSGGECKCQARTKNLSVFLSAPTALSFPAAFPRSHRALGSTRSLGSLGSRIHWN